MRLTISDDSRRNGLLRRSLAAIKYSERSGIPSVGNFTLQFSLEVQNFTGSSQTPNIYVVPISSGFVETIKGSTRIIKGVLTEQDILSAPARAPEADLERSVGAGRHGGMKHIKMSGQIPHEVAMRGRFGMGAYM